MQAAIDITKAPRAKALPVEQIAAKFEPKMKVVLLRSFAALKDVMSAAKLSRAIEDRGVVAVYDLLDLVPAKTQAELMPVLQEAFQEGGRLIADLPKGAINESFSFNMLNSKTAERLRTYSFNLIKQVSDGTIKGIRESLRLSNIAGLNPRHTARQFRSDLGLTAKQVNAVDNYRKHLENLDRDALRRKLRDRRFDGTINRAIEEGNPLKPAQIDKLVGRYRERYIKYRSEVIARTESMRAVELANHESLAQAAEEGAVSDKLRRFWVFTRGERTRAAHKAIPRMNPNGVKVNERFVTPLGQLMYPRDPAGSAQNTVQCRCTVTYRMVSDINAKPPVSSKPAVKPDQPKEKPKRAPKPKVVGIKREWKEQSSPSEKKLNNAWKHVWGDRSAKFKTEGYVTSQDKKDLLDKFNFIGRDIHRMLEENPGLRGLKSPTGKTPPFSGLVFHNLKNLPSSKDPSRKGANGNYMHVSRVINIAGRQGNVNREGRLPILGKWSVSSANNDIRATVRHEFGHSLHSDGKVITKMEKKAKLRQSFEYIWGEVFEGRTKKEISGMISRYSLTNNREAFAECFAAFTDARYQDAPGYMLPGPLHDYFTKLLGSKKKV
jgi:AraC-like DNA-binding protein